MSRRFHIAVDMDDVLVDFVGGLRRAMYTEYGVEIPEEAITEWDLHPVLDPIIGRSWWGWLRDRDWLWATFPAIPGAIGNIDFLRRQGHMMELVTSKPEWAEYNVWQWLGKWRPAFHRVTICGPDVPKINVTDANLIIDDKPANIEPFLIAGRNGIIFTRPHNRFWRQSNNQDPLAMLRYERAEDWNEVREIIRRLSNG